MSAWRKAPCKALPCITKRSASGFASHNAMYVLQKPRNWQSDYWSQPTILAPLCLILHSPLESGFRFVKWICSWWKAKVRRMGLKQTEYREELLMSFALLIRLSCILYHSSSSGYQSSLEESFYLPNILHQIKSDLAYLQTWPIFCTGEFEGMEHPCPSTAPICQLEREFSRITAVSCVGSLWKQTARMGQEGKIQARCWELEDSKFKLTFRHSATVLLRMKYVGHMQSTE